MNRPMKTRRFKKADCELDFFFISGAWARARVIRYVAAAFAKLPAPAFGAKVHISEPSEAPPMPSKTAILYGMFDLIRAV